MIPITPPVEPSALDETPAQRDTRAAAMSRRTFLKRTGLGTTALLLGGLAWRVGGVWWDQPARTGYKVLSHDEVLISDAIADALFPGAPGPDGYLPGGVEVGLTKFLDNLLATTFRGESANLLRVLLHAIDDMGALAGGWRRFHLRPRDERIAILNAWEGSFLAGRRQAFGALKIMYSMGYLEDRSVLRALNIEYTCGDLT